MPFLENQIVLLRPPEPSDLDLLYNWENNVEIWNAGLNVCPMSKFVLEKYIESAHLDVFDTKQLRLMIVLKSEMRVIGNVDLFEFDSFNNRAGVGILIAQNADRQKGYASGALSLLKSYCFDILGLTQIFCNIAADNPASKALFEKHGFVTVGLKKKWTRRGSKFIDEYLLQLLNPQL